jgi:hypothetical protein
MAGERHGNSMACVNQTRPHCVNQMGNTQSEALVERHGMGMAGERHGMCEPALTRLRDALVYTYIQGRPLGGASGALAPGAEFEGAPKRRSPTGHTLYVAL